MEDTQQTSSDLQQNFGLTLAEFTDMVEELRSGNDAIFKRIFLVHFSDCTHFLESKLKADPVDAYDAAIDTLLEFCKRLKRGKIQYGNLRYLFTQMARQALYRIRKKHNPVTDLDEASDVQSVDERPDDDTLEVLALAWKKLGEQCQRLLRGFYYDNTSLGDLAKTLEKSEVATRKQKQRCMQKLQTYFKALDGN